MRIFVSSLKQNRQFFTHPKRVLFFLICSVVLTSFFAVEMKDAFATEGINETINFQGRVANTDGTNVTDGSYDFIFRLYKASSGGSAQWTETWDTGTSQVTVTNGIFRVALGTHTSLSSLDFNDDSWYLSVEFNNDDEMEPRIQFASVPYALNAKKVSGLTVTDTTGTFTLADGKTFVVNNGLTFSGTDSTTFTFPSSGGNIVTEDFAQTLTSKTIGSTGLVFSGATTDITTVSNENLVISPNGTGNVGFGNTDPSYPVHISLTGSDTDTNNPNNGILAIDGTLTSSTRNQTGILSAPEVDPGSASNQLYWGLVFQPYTNSSNLDDGSLGGIFGGPYIYGSSDVLALYGAYLQNQVDETATAGTAYGAYIDNPYKASGATITTNHGLYVVDQTSGTSDYGLTIEGADTQALWLGSGADNTDSANGIAFGSSRDTTLYRSGSNTLATGGSLNVGANSTINPISSGTLGIGTSNTTVLDLGIAITGTTNVNGGNINLNGNTNVASGNSFSVVSGEAAVTGKNSGSATTLRVNNHTSTGSIFIAQDAATDIFTVADGGNVILNTFTSDANAVLFTDTSGVITRVTETETGNLCLLSGSGGSGVPTWGSCTAGGSSSSWVLNASDGTLSPINNTLDLLVGGAATTSAKFAILGVASDTPSASVSASTGSGISINSDGSIQTTRNRTLTLGGNTTGNINLRPRDGLGSVIVNSATFEVYGPSGFGNANDYTSIDTDGDLSFVGTADYLIAIGGKYAFRYAGDEDYGLFFDDSAASYDFRSGSASNVFRVSALSGILTSAAYTTNGGLLYSTSTGVFTQLGAGSTGQCLTANTGAAPAWNSCGGSSNWVLNSGAGTLSPINNTLDFLWGGTATDSAKFAILGVASDSPIASLSASTGFGLSLGHSGTIQTTRNQTLTLGGDTTGNILLSPLNGAGLVTVDGTLAAATGGSATFVVAASDSPTRIKAQADYVADGTADEVQIQAAIDALPSTGGQIQLAQGTYNLADTISITANKRIRISGFGAILRPATSVVAITVNQGISNAQGAVIEGVTIDGQSNSGTTGILLEDTNNPAIYNARIVNVTTGIHINSEDTNAFVEGLAIEDVLIRDCTAAGTGISLTTNNGTGSFAQHQWRTVKIANCDTGINLASPSQFYRSYIENATIWIGEDQDGIVIDGDVLLSRMEINVEAATGSTGHTAITIGSNATNTEHLDFYYTQTGTVDTILSNSSNKHFTYKKNRNWFTSGSMPALQMYAHGDSQERLGFRTSFSGGGGLLFGPGGATAPDTNLYRAGVDTLKTDDSFTVGSNLIIEFPGGSPSINTSNEGMQSASIGNLDLHARGSYRIFMDSNNNSSDNLRIFGDGTSKELLRLEETGGKALLSINNYWSSQDIFTASSSGETRLRLDSSGNLGLGVLGADTIEGQLHIRSINDAGDATLVLDADRGDDSADKWSLIAQASDNDLSFENDATELFKVTSSGSVYLAGGQNFDTLSNNTLAIGTTNATTITFGRSGQGITLPGFDCSALTNGGKLTTTSGGVLTCSNDTGGGGGGGSSNWVLNPTDGTLSPINNTLDFLWGGSATDSAKFGILNVAGSGPVTATLSGNLIVMPVDGAGGFLGIGNDNPTRELDIYGRGYIYNEISAAATGSEEMDTFRSIYQYNGVAGSPATYAGSAANFRTYFGNGSNSPVGTAGGISSHINVQSSGDSENEYTPLLLDMSGNASGRYWGADVNIHGPYSTQADLLTGIVTFINNYNSDDINDGSYGNTIVTRPGAGGGDAAGDRSSRTTYSLGSGLAITGWSGPTTATNGDHASATVGFDKAIQIGGQAGGWQGPTEISKIGTGIDLRDFVNYGIYIHDRHSDAASSAPAIAIAADQGGVGIGTTAPASQLHVYKSGIADGVAKFESGSGGSIMISSQSDALYQKIVNVPGNDNYITGSVAGDSGIVYKDTFGYLFGPENGRVAMRIDSNGLLGIGTSAPISELHVSRSLTLPVTGKSLAIFDQLEDQDIIAASASGTTVFRVTQDGSLESAGHMGLGNETSITSSDLLNLVEDYSGTSDFTGINTQITKSTAVGEFYGIVANPTYTGSGDNSANNFIGINSTPFYSGSGDMINSIGIYSQAVSMQTGSSGVVGSTYGLYVGNPSVIGGTGTVTDNIGIYVAPMTTGGTSDVGVAIDAAETQTLWLDAHGSGTTSNAGIAFGSARDTLLYRSGSNTLTTGSLQLGRLIFPSVSSFDSALDYVSAYVLGDVTTSARGDVRFIIDSNNNSVGTFKILANGNSTEIVNIDESGNIFGAANTAYDTLASGTLGIGTTTATTITLGRSGQTIALAGYTNSGSGCGALATNGSGVITCSSTGEAQTPWTSDIDGDNFSLLDMGTNITARNGLTLGTGSGGNLTLTPNGTGDVVVSGDGDTNFQVNFTAPPTVNMAVISNSGQGTIGNGVNGLVIDFTQGDDAEGADVNAGLVVDVTSSSGDADALIGMWIADITGGTATEMGLFIGEGWDMGLVISSGGATNSGLVYTGDGRPTKTITLSPEYAGAVLTDYYGAGTDSNITGAMTSDTDTTQGTSIRNYYQWLRTTDSTQHFYTVAVRVTLPADFDAWTTSNAVVVNYITGSATNTVSDLDVRVYNENDSTIVASSTDNASTSWTTVAIDDSTLDDGTSSEWDSAGETAVIYLRMGSASSNYVRVGDIKLNYLAKF